MKRVYIFSGLFVFSLLLSGGSIYQADAGSSGAQPLINTKFLYYIQSAQEIPKSWKGLWDLPGIPSSNKNGQNIQVWEVLKGDSSSTDRLYKFYHVKNDIYEIAMSFRNRENYRIDVAGGGTANGSNVHVYAKNSSNTQRFRMKYLGGGKWKMYTMTGKVVCLAGRSSQNGSNVHVWDDHDGPWMEWRLITWGFPKRVFMPKSK